MIVKFKGGKELERRLKALGDPAAARRTAERALDRAAVPIRDKARQLAPDDPETGLGNYLRESIRIGKRAEVSRSSKRFRRSDAGQDIVERYIGIDPTVLPPREPKTDRRRKRAAGGSSGGAVAFYSIVQEFGDVRNVAQPYMRPAWEAEKMTAFNLIRDTLSDEIIKTAGRQARKAAKSGV